MQRSIELNVRGNARICVPPSLELITPYVLLEQEDWFEDEIPFVRRLLRPGMHAVDVGASFGMYSMAMAMGVGAGGPARPALRTLRCPRSPWISLPQSTDWAASTSSSWM